MHHSSAATIPRLQTCPSSAKPPLSACHFHLRAPPFRSNSRLSRARNSRSTPACSSAIPRTTHSSNCSPDSLRSPSPTPSPGRNPLPHIAHSGNRSLHSASKNIPVTRPRKARNCSRSSRHKTHRNFVPLDCSAARSRNSGSAPTGIKRNSPAPVKLHSVVPPAPAFPPSPVLPLMCPPPASAPPGYSAHQSGTQVLLRRGSCNTQCCRVPLPPPAPHPAHRARHPRERPCPFATVVLCTTHSPRRLPPAG